MNLRMSEELKKEQILQLFSKQSLMSVATTNQNLPDNSVVCFAYDSDCYLYFGSYSDTLKCKNIGGNSRVAITMGTLQIHGIAELIPYDSADYKRGREIYDQRFPKYQNLFELEMNELYRIKPLVIWNYNSLVGEMHRDVMVFDSDYYESIEVYEPHEYKRREKRKQLVMLGKRE